MHNELSFVDIFYFRPSSQMFDTLDKDRSGDLGLKEATKSSQRHVPHRVCRVKLRTVTPSLSLTVDRLVASFILKRGRRADSLHRRHDNGFGRHGAWE